MAKKKRISLRLENDEIAVVGSQARWEHLILMYEAFAMDAHGEDKVAWLDSVAWIREWIDHAKVKENTFEEGW